MEERLVLRMMGIVSLAMAAAMLPSLVCALNQEPEMVLPFLGTIFIGFALGAYAIRTTVSQRKMRPFPSARCGYRSGAAPYF